MRTGKQNSKRRLTSWIQESRLSCKGEKRNVMLRNVRRRQRCRRLRQRPTRQKQRRRNPDVPWFKEGGRNGLPFENPNTAASLQRITANWQTIKESNSSRLNVTSP